MKQIKISKEISLPLDLVTQTIAILAKRRVGKSYTMRRIAEQLLECQQQIVIVDPKGDQWGIRSSADGKKPGFPIVILGGEHGDAPLEVNSGEIVAKLIVEEHVSILLDLSVFRKHEIATFMAIFLENLYRLKAQEKYRTPVMLVVDEADAIAPQKPQKGEERMLGAIEDVVRRGGQRGIGCILVTQRSAVLNKNVLTQAQMLIVLRTIAPQDLSAMKAWIDVHGSIEEGKTLMDSLPSLPIGDAWFWSPGWPTSEGIFQLVHVSPITTFDSAATPKPGEKKVTPKNLADVDMEALKKQMASTIEKAKNDDPKELKKEIQKLKQELVDIEKKKVTNFIDPKIIQKDIDMAVRKALDKQGYQHTLEVNKRLKIFEQIQKLIEPYITQGLAFWSASEEAAFHKPVNVYKNEFKHIPKNLPRVIPGIMIPPMVIKDDESKPLTKCARAIRDYLHSVAPKSKTKAQIWIATGYTPGGGFNNCIYELTGKDFSKQIILKHTDGTYSYNDNSPSGEVFDTSLEKWFPKLTLCARKIFQLLLEDPQNALGKEELARRTGYAQGGGFNNCIYELTGPELIKKVPEGYTINPEILDL